MGTSWDRMGKYDPLKIFQTKKRGAWARVMVQTFMDLAISNVWNFSSSSWNQLTLGELLVAFKACR